MRLFTYVRYLNQKGLDPTYTDYFGNTHTVKQREDVQLNKFFMPFSGWFLTPKFRYYLYVWSSNPSQGEPAQVVGGGNISYTFNNHVTLGGGISALPSNRSTEGQFPYWLGMDDRLIADEFFRGSYTTGIWLKGELSTKVKYVAMLANNLSTLGVSASQLDNTFDTTTLMLQWVPSTGEFGPNGEFGDFAHHEKVATRLAAHYTHSTEDKQSQPGTNGIENSQVRLTDGSVIFTPDLFGPGIAVEKLKYQLVSVDGGIKYKGLALEAEYYWRWLSQLPGQQRRRDRRHRRPRLPGPVLRDGRAQEDPGLSQRLGDPGPLWQRIGSARRRQLVHRQGTRAASQSRVDPPEQVSCWIHGGPLSGRRQRGRLPRELRDVLLRLTRP